MPSQYEGYDNLNSLLESWVTPLQSVEDLVIYYMNSSGITTASSGLLDVIGGWVGVSRDARVDEEYRVAILAKGLLESADGTTEVFLQGLRTLCQTTYATFHEYLYGHVYAYAGEGVNNAVLDELRAISPAGIHVRLIVDDRFDSFSHSEILSIDNNLVTGDEEPYILENGSVEGEWEVSESSGEELDEDGDYLAEILDEEWTPLAEMVIRGKIVLSDLVDGDNNPITDEDGETIQTATLVRAEVII